MVGIIFNMIRALQSAMYMRAVIQSGLTGYAFISTMILQTHHELITAATNGCGSNQAKENLDPELSLRAQSRSEDEA